jgi:hypothetical protein
MDTKEVEMVSSRIGRTGRIEHETKENWGFTGIHENTAERLV